VAPAIGRIESRTRQEGIFMMAKLSGKDFAGSAKRELRFAYRHALVNYFFFWKLTS
jgi:hypothetical protein